jgi:protein arginine N-methyltransferase 1
MAGYPSLMGFHRHLLDDTVRTDTFIRAIQQVVRQDDTVVDLGSGTGILAMACLRAGAHKVYAIEADQLIVIAEQAARANAMADQIVFMHKHSSGVTLPEKVDVIVSECLGLMGIGGSMIPAVVDMRRRGLKAGGRVIPRGLSLFLVPVESPLHYTYAHFWDQKRLYGFDFSAFQEAASHNVYVAWFKEANFICAPQQVATVDLLTDDVSHVEAQLTFSPTRACCLHGFCGWFEASLCDGISLSTAPASHPTIWKQLYLPLGKEVVVETGSRIQVDLRISTGATPGSIPEYFRWHTDVIRPGGHDDVISFRQSTLKSFPRKA